MAGLRVHPGVAGLASVVGVYFQRASLGLRRRMKASRVPAWLLPAAGAIITWALGAAVFAETHRLGVFSLGYDDLSQALAGDLGWQLAAVLLGGIIATFTCYGFGGCGDIFSPTLFFGGMTGVVVAGLVNLQWPVAQADVAPWLWSA